MLKNSVKVLDTPLFEESYRIAVAKGESEILSQVNIILKDMLQSGEIDKIVQKYVSSLEENDTSLKSQIYNNLISKQRYITIFQGLATTLEITCVALIIGIILGVAVALVGATRSESAIVKILKFIATSILLIPLEEKIM